MADFRKLRIEAETLATRLRVEGQAIEDDGLAVKMLETAARAVDGASEWLKWLEETPRRRTG